MSENLFAYTATNSGYSQGTAGAINGERAAAATALSAVKNELKRKISKTLFYGKIL